MIIFRFVKNIFFKTKLYDYYLSKNSIEEISFTPKDIWPGDPILGDQLVQGYYNLANKKIYSRQKSPQVFEMNASIYIWKNKALMNKSNLVTSKTAFYEMPEERSIDIDTMLDWKIVSFLMEKK